MEDLFLAWWPLSVFMFGLLVWMSMDQGSRLNGVEHDLRNLKNDFDALSRENEQLRHQIAILTGQESE